MDILKCKCGDKPIRFYLKKGGVLVSGIVCQQCKRATPAYNQEESAVIVWNEAHGAQPSEPHPAVKRCVKCKRFTPVKGGELCVECIRKLPRKCITVETGVYERRESQQSDYHKAKHDAGKLPLNLIPPSTYDALGRVMQYGAGLYGEDTWQNLPDGTKRCHAALLRHLVAWHGGEKVDPESGLPHLEHVLWNAAVLVEFEE